MKFQKTDEDWFSKNILKFALSLFKRVISPLLLPISGHIAHTKLGFVLVPKMCVLLNLYIGKEDLSKLYVMDILKMRFIFCQIFQHQ